LENQSSGPCLRSHVPLPWVPAKAPAPGGTPGGTGGTPVLSACRLTRLNPQGNPWGAHAPCVSSFAPRGRLSPCPRSGSLILVPPRLTLGQNTGKPSAPHEEGCGDVRSGPDANPDAARMQPGCAGTEVRLRRVDSKWRAGAPSTTRGARVLPTPHARFQKIEAATFGENPDPSIRAPCPPSPGPTPKYSSAVTPSALGAASASPPWEPKVPALGAKLPSSTSTEKPPPPAPVSPSRTALLPPAAQPPAGRRVSFCCAENPHPPNDPATLNRVKKTCKSCWVGYAPSLEIISIGNQALNPMPNRQMKPIPQMDIPPDLVA
jgi:hypothetical protein